MADSIDDPKLKAEDGIKKSKEEAGVYVDAADKRDGQRCKAMASKLMSFPLRIGDTILMA